MQKIISHSQVFSSISFYQSIHKANVLVIDIHEHYQKRSSRNRYQILTTNGIQTLSIPLRKGKNQQMPLKDVTIAYDEKWVENHIQTIRSAYGKSPYFEYYYDDIVHILQKKYQNLYDLNVECLVWTLSKLNLNIPIETTISYIELYEDGLDLRNITCTESIFKPYVQVWNEKFDFIPNLSILDLLFCSGPEAKAFL